MVQEQGALFWRVVLAACAIVGLSLTLPPVAGEAVCALVVLGAVVLMLRRRKGANRSLRLLTVGATLLGVAPVVTEMHRSIGGGELFSAGDANCDRRLPLHHRCGSPPREAPYGRPADACRSRCTFHHGVARSGHWVRDHRRRPGSVRCGRPALGARVRPFTLALIFVVLWLGLGAGDRSGAFVLLVAATTSAAVSEFLFLESAVGGELPRRLGIAVATAALVLFTAAFFHPSARGLEEPHPGSVGRTSQLLAAMIGSSTVAVVGIAFFIELRTFEVMILLFLGSLTAARAVLIVRERDEWLALQRAVSDFAAVVAELDDNASVRDHGVAAVEAMLARKILTFADVHQAGEIDESIFERGDPSGVSVNEIDGDLWRAIETGQTQRHEFLLDGSKNYSTRLVVPIGVGVTSPTCWW